MSAHYLNHGAAETTQSCLYSVRFCSGGAESPALSNPLLCVCICSAARGNQSDPMHPCGMSMPFSHIHIVKIFLPRDTPELLLIMQFTAHRGRNTESLFLELFHPASLGLNGTLSFQQT